MRPTFLPLILLLSSCGTLRHSLDDLQVVHGKQGTRLMHHYKVDRYGWFSGGIHFGALGRGVPLLDRWLASRSVQSLDDPGSFCAERTLDLAEANPSSIETWTASSYWAANILLGDLNVLSRLYAAKIVSGLGENLVTPSIFQSAFFSDEEGYGEKVLARTHQMEGILRLRNEGQESEGDRTNFREALIEIAQVRFRSPLEGLSAAETFGLFWRQADARERELLRKAIDGLVARSFCQALIQGLEDRNEFVREASLLALYRVVGKSVFTEAWRLLALDPSPTVRIRLVRIASELSMEEALQPLDNSPLDFLVKATRDPEGSVAVNAMTALSLITRQNLNYDREYWRSWWKNYWLTH